MVEKKRPTKLRSAAADPCSIFCSPALMAAAALAIHKQSFSFLFSKLFSFWICFNISMLYKIIGVQS